MAARVNRSSRSPAREQANLASSPSPLTPHPQAPDAGPPWNQISYQLGSEDDEPVWIDPLKWFLKKVAPIVRTVTTKANSATGSGSLMVSKISLDIVVTVRYDTGRCNTRSCGDNPANNFEWNKKRLQDTVVLPTKQRQIQPNEMDAFDLADMTHFRLQMYKLHEITSDFVGTHMRKDQITGRLKNHISQRGLRKVGRGRPCRVFGI